MHVYFANNDDDNKVITINERKTHKRKKNIITITVAILHNMVIVLCQNTDNRQPIPCLRFEIWAAMFEVKKSDLYSQIGVVLLCTISCYNDPCYSGTLTYQYHITSLVSSLWLQWRYHSIVLNYRYCKILLGPPPILRPLTHCPLREIWRWFQMCNSVEKHVLLVCEFIWFCMRKIAPALQCKCSFCSAKSNKSADQQDMFCFNHAFAFYTSNNIMKNVDE